uniref:Ig-like domain-containing protein n=1 Tax=Anopheles coluzzii TaxID=1518534 RepID=A0A8W7PDW2_ANOCL
LESVHIQVPVAVLVGTSATLICECDLPDDELYSVKWYKGKHEFFRYTSKEIPSIKIFPKAGISVNVNACFDTKHRLILHDMNYFPEKKCRGMNCVMHNSSGSSSSSSSRKKQSAKSSLPAPTVPPSTDGESRENDLAEVLPGRPRPAIGTTNGGSSSSSTATTTITTTTTSSSSSSSSQEPAGNGTSGEHRKGAGNSRYELAVSRLKLLLEHGHFRNGKLKVRAEASLFCPPPHSPIPPMHACSGIWCTV